MQTAVKFFCGIFVFLAGATSAFAGDVIVNEIMFHQASTNVLEEWFELYNAGSTAVNLSGWQITKGVAFTFPTNTVLVAGGYLVVEADGPTFAAKHPGVANFVAGWAGTLGHSLELSDNTGHVINSIEFYAEGDWAARVLGAGGVAGALDHYGGLGWGWSAPHGVAGSSLEVSNPALPHTYAPHCGPSAPRD